MFGAAVRALDDSYGVESRRNIVAQYALGLVFTVGAIATMVTGALLIVVGPLLGDGKQIAESLGFGDAFQLAWDWLRWPVAFGIGLMFSSRCSIATHRTSPRPGGNACRAECSARLA